MPDSIVTTTLTGATRIGCSVNGNPTWVLHTTDGDFRTMSDASCGYNVGNLLPRRHLGQTDPTVSLTLTRAGRVRSIYRAPGVPEPRPSDTYRHGAELDVVQR